MTARDTATRLLALRVVKDWIATEERHLRDTAAAALVVGERVPGVLDPDDADTVLGFVQKVKGRQTQTVTDPAAFLAWCEEHAPGEVVTRREVRPSFVTALLAAVKASGGWPDPDTGELLDVPGVEERASEATLTVKPCAEADGLVRAALADRRLALTPATGAAPDAAPDPGGGR